MERLRELAHDRARLYMYGCCLVLFGSTAAWALAGAHLQQNNADQFADGFLFEDGRTFRGAIFPQAHAQFLKWPLFWLLGRLHNSPGSYLVLSTAVALACVAVFAWMLYRIERRPLVFGTMCLALASVLAMVPAFVQGHTSAPLNMSLLTGRNLEYVVYVAALALLVRARGWKTWQWAAAGTLLCILFAGDQLFIALGLASAALLYAADRWGGHMPSARNCLQGVVAAAVLSLLVLPVLRALGIDFAGGGSGPEGLMNSWHGVWPALGYTGKALLLNGGITGGMGGWSWLAAAVNGLVMVILAIAVGALLRRGSGGRGPADRPTQLSLLLLGSAATATVLYVATQHNYQADARYLAIWLFAAFVALAAAARRYRAQQKVAAIAASILVLSILVGSWSVWHFTDRSLAASQLARRNAAVAAALQARPVSVLAGSYWRVLPIKALSPRAAQAVIPLQGCLQPVDVLRSTAWQTDVFQHSFAYLLSVRSDGTPFPPCNLRIVEYVYGRPSSMQVIAGTRRNPAELLLFYKDGASNHRGNAALLLPPRPVFGAPTAGNAAPTGSTMTPLAKPSWSSGPPS